MIDYTDHECRLLLEELYRGDKVIIPHDMEHAKFMLRIAQQYINAEHQHLMDTVKYSESKR
jgi:hypothetical protein